MTRHYGFYSNKARGVRAKTEQMEIEDPDKETFVEHGKIIDVSTYQPKKVPSLTWRECIKKIWKDDPLICPECSSVMKIISFIEKPQIIKKILKILLISKNQFPIIISSTLDFKKPISYHLHVFTAVVR